ncbi:MAG: LPXTG cell wall anchor domain-containing protein [Ruminococcus sp.]|nr:LPXTG cell wall anchor domain-containing protein [Ruminococcus sp.]
MKKTRILSLLLSAAISLTPLCSIAASAEESSYSFNICFVTEESEKYVENVNAKLIQQAIAWTDDEHYVYVGDGVVVSEWNTSIANPFITESFSDNWHDYIYRVVVDELPDGYNFNSSKRVESGISGYLDGEVKVSIELDEEEILENTTPLEGTYSLNLNVMDIVRKERIVGLDCELFNIQTGDIVAAWNTSETEEMYIENLQYSFDRPDSYNGNITYAIRITNLPENYRFFYGKTRDQYGVSGFSLEEFVNGTNLSCTVYLEDTSEDAPKYTYVSTPQANITTVTTTTTIAEPSPLTTTVTDENGNFIDENGNIVTTSETSKTEPPTIITTTTSGPADLNDIPLEGTYSLKLSVMDIVRNEKIAGLNCELFNIQSGDVVAAWNTSETEEMYIENLQYSFDRPDSYNGNITYAIRITNLPENYRFFYGKSRDFYGISGFGLEEFANGTDLNCVAYLEDTSDDAPKYTYVSTPQGNTTIVTTTTIAEATPSTTTVTDENGNFIDENGNIVTTSDTSKTETQTTTTTTTTSAPADLNDIPLEGTYSLKLNVMDIARNQKIAGLNCELFNIQNGDIVAAWNTSETEEMYIENLQYSFDRPDSYNGNITYAIRITNLPENYRFFYGKNRDQYGVSGFSLEEFVNGTNLSCTIYLEDTSDDAPKYTYVTTPQDSTTTTTTTTAQTENNEETLPQTGYSSIYKVVAGLASLMTLSGAAILVKTRKKDE